MSHNHGHQRKQNHLLDVSIMSEEWITGVAAVGDTDTVLFADIEYHIEIAAQVRNSRMH